jgi:hypothetical protein
VSAKVIFPINYHNDIPHLVKTYCGRRLRFFCMRSNFIGISNRNEIPSNRSIFEFRADESKIQHQYTVYGGKRKMLFCELARVISLNVEK